ncbi:hypothetical protein LK540_14185 [Massilia sp. IC2-278]|uniref:hypothetical protein n=1 Tax=Massilia sp. IC2-278 TaxID=2887200 RepID=UPI001E51733D|nr:hypothetical protein [Massilia sp. IC2-278]MCC2961575.1 hypothetical protein [Massilia sp. IC2-278]
MDQNTVVIVAIALAVIGVTVVKRLLLKSSLSPGRRLLMLGALAAAIMAVMSLLLATQQ